MTKEQILWVTAAELINMQHSKPLVDPESHEDDETIQPVYDALKKFGEAYYNLRVAELADR